MSSTRYLVADVFDGLAALKAEGTQVDLVLSSPPFLALRSYLPPDHPDKAREIGSEPTPAAFLSTMLDVVEACADVLAPHGTLAFEFGDTYAGSGGAGGDYAEDGLRAGQEMFDGSARKARRKAGDSPDRDDHPRPARARTRSTPDGWPLDKSMCMIPELFAASLAYGRNLLDPERTTDPWRIRNTIAWVRPNPPVGALGDKFRPAKSLITVAAKARDRWFDLDAVRTAPSDDRRQAAYVAAGAKGAFHDHSRDDLGRNQAPKPVSGGVSNPAGAPPLDWWKISPGGYSGSHYAVWPPELLSRPIEAMCPRRVCRTCGTPSRRIVGDAEYHQSPNAHAGRAEHKGLTEALTWKSGIAEGKGQRSNATDGGRMRVAPTEGWTTCGCPGTDGIRIDGYHTGPGWRPGIVLDPFGGSGTTGLVANGLSRDAILLDLDERNAELARDRLGMFLTVEHLEREDVA